MKEMRWNGVPVIVRMGSHYTHYVESSANKLKLRRDSCDSLTRAGQSLPGNFTNNSRGNLMVKSFWEPRPTCQPELAGNGSTFCNSHNELHRSKRSSQLTCLWMVTETPLFSVVWRYSEMFDLTIMSRPNLAPGFTDRYRCLALNCRGRFFRQ